MSGPAQASELEMLRAKVARLEREQAFSKTILENAPAIVMRVSLEGVIEFVNHLLPQYASDTPVGRSIYSFLSVDQHQQVREALAEARKTRLPRGYESLVQGPDGKDDWYVTTAGPIIENDQVVALTLISVNTSRERKAEEALRGSRARLALALDAGNVGLWQWERHNDLVEWDEKLDTMFGLGPGRSPRNVADFLALIPEDQRQQMGEHIGRALATGMYPDFELTVDVRGQARWFMIKGGMLRGPGGEITGLLGGVVDITERRRIDEHLREAQKLEAVGQLSAGVAHNFNNMLGVIMPALELTRMAARPEDSVLLDDALTSATNAALLVRELMVFSHRGPSAGTRQEPLSEVVRRAVELCRRTFERRVSLQLGELEAARFAGVAAAPMEQAVMNLLLNARDALAEVTGRPLRIEVRARALDAKEAARRQPAAVGPYVELQISDTGCGMNAATRSRMLEPFFTTKPLGRGTGLGLATAWATVQVHRGFLECDSQLEAGTTFFLLLPAQAQPVADSAPGSRGDESGGTGQLILVVDDEAAVARTNTAVLRSAGFRVVSAASGEEALELVRSTPVDAVVLDYSMPGLSAQQTLAGLRSRSPKLPVVCLSGLGIALEGATLQLTKPASRGELVAAVEKALRPPP